MPADTPTTTAATVCEDRGCAVTPRIGFAPHWHLDDGITFTEPTQGPDNGRMATDDDGAIRVRCQGCATLVLTEVVLRQIRRVVIHDRDDDGRECIGSRYVVEIVQLDDDA